MKNRSIVSARGVFKLGRVASLLFAACLAQASPDSALIAVDGSRDHHPSRDKTFSEVPAEGALRSTLVKRLRSSTMAFELNRGQVRSNAKALAHGLGYTVYLSGNEAIFALRTPQTAKVLSTAPPTCACNSKELIPRRRLLASSPCRPRPIT